MTILHDVYIALLSGLTHKTGNEIHWQSEDNYPITIEPVNIEQCKYIIRTYNNGKINWETEYKNGKKHGKSAGWYCNGQKAWEDEYKNGQLHGTSMSWRMDGQKYLEIEYQNGQQHGKSMRWNHIGQKYLEVEFEYGKLVRNNHIT